jgi:hypothetical protein
MAGKFYAVTDIRHGKRTEDGSAEGKYERTTFSAGDEVKGLSKEDMKSLWEAGALEQRDDAPEKEKEEEEGDDETKAGDEAKVQDAPKSPTPAKAAPAKAATPAK